MARTVRRVKPSRSGHNRKKCDWCMSMRRLQIRQDRKADIKEQSNA